MSLPDENTKCRKRLFIYQIEFKKKKMTGVKGRQMVDT